MRPKQWILFAAAALLAGCTAMQGHLRQPSETAMAEPVPPLEPSAPPAFFYRGHPGAADIAWLLEYYQRLTLQNGAALEEEYRRIKQTAENEPSPRNRLWLALLLTLPGTKFQDDRRAMEIFKEYSGDNKNGEDARANFAALMSAFIASRQALKERGHALEQQTRELQSSNQTLKEQLDALKAIEKNLAERERKEGLKAK